jgi:hypothetical protein
LNNKPTRLEKLAIQMLCMLLLAAVLFIPASAQESAQGLSMQVQASFDGYFKFGEWLPVQVELENNGPDLTGEVQVSVAGSQGSVVYAAPVSLPTVSRKRFFLYVLPNNYSQEMDVRLVNDQGPLITKRISVNPQPNINYLIGLLAPERGALSLMKGIQFPGNGRSEELIDLTLQDLPDRPEGLRSFDCLVLDGIDTSSLTQEQAAALEAWVQEGGRLVLGTGAQAQQTIAGLPASLLPLIPDGDTQINTLPELADFAGSEAIRVPGPFIVSTGQPQEGQDLVTAGVLPLVRERKVGQGAVDYVALGLRSAPFDAWSGTTSFWEKLISPGAYYPEGMPPDMSDRQQRSSQMPYALSNMPALDLPSVRGLAMLLGIYILLVGPVNYLVLRWRKRLHWAWITIPLVTGIFSAGAFGMGYIMRGTDLILNKIALIELGSGGSAKVTTYLGLFSPGQQAYEIQVKGGSLLSPIQAYSDPWSSSGAPVGSEMTFVQGDPGEVRGLTVNQWSMQSFMTEGIWTDFGKINADVQVGENGLVGSLRNETRYELKDAALVLGNNFTHLGNLAPGQAAEVKMIIGNLEGRDFGQPLSYLLFQDEFNSPGPNGIPREIEQKRIIIQSLFEMGPWGALSSKIAFPTGYTTANQSLVLLGWLDQSPLEVSVSGRQPTQMTTGLVYTILDYHLPEEGPISLPTGLIPGSMIQVPLEGGACGGPMGTSSVFLARGDAIFEFRLPGETQGLKVETIKLSLSTDNGFWQAPGTAIYDWKAQAWAALDKPVQGLNVIKEAASLASEDGRIQVRLTAQNNVQGCYYLSLGLDGTRTLPTGGTQ